MLTPENRGGRPVRHTGTAARQADAGRAAEMADGRRSGPDRLGAASGAETGGRTERRACPARRAAGRRRRSGGAPLVTAPDLPRDIAFVSPRPLQTVSGAGLIPLITDRQGRIVLGQLPDRTFVCARRSRSAVQYRHGRCATGGVGARAARLAEFERGRIDLFRRDADGFGRSPSPLKLAFDPPFLAMTLAVAVAVLLAAWQGAVRFGAPRRRERAIAFGKAALIDNAAALVRKGRPLCDARRPLCRYDAGSRGERCSASRRTCGTVRWTRISMDLAGPRGSATSPRRPATRATGMRWLSAAQALHNWLWEKNR